VRSRSSSPVAAFDDAHVEVGDEHHDAGSGVFVAEADVVEAAVVAQGDASGLVVMARPGRAGRPRRSARIVHSPVTGRSFGRCCERLAGAR
jgi:hypothetical protein